MENREQNDAIIAAFLMDQMSKEERGKFQLKMKNNPDLVEQVNFHKGILAGTQLEGRKALRQELESIHHQKDRSINVQPVAKKRSLTPWLAAASVALLLLATWFFMRPADNHQQLFAQYYQAYDLTIGLRDPGTQEALAQIDQLYSAADYQAVIPLFQKYLESHPQENPLRLGLAISQIETNDLENALVNLEQLKQSEDVFLQDHIRWYAALIHVKKGNRDLAVPLLQQLANNTNADHHTSAQSLLKDLE